MVKIDHFSIDFPGTYPYSDPLSNDSSSDLCGELSFALRCLLLGLYCSSSSESSCFKIVSNLARLLPETG